LVTFTLKNEKKIGDNIKMDCREMNPGGGWNWHRIMFNGGH
jgi:hypothetical protein